MFVVSAAFFDTDRTIWPVCFLSHFMEKKLESVPSLEPKELLRQTLPMSSAVMHISISFSLPYLGKQMGLRVLTQGCKPTQVYGIFLSISELIFYSEAASG